MQVNNNVQINYRATAKPTFTSNSIFVMGGKYWNSSSFLRPKFEWIKFIDKMVDNFKNIKKVNLYCHACSDGSEPYTIVMLLLEKLGPQDAKKFLPIKAFDFDPNIIEMTKSDNIKLGREDVKRIKKTFGDNYKKYMEFDEKYYFDKEANKEVCKGKIKPIVKENVIFKTADIRNEIENIEPKNSVVFARNFWPYITNQTEQRNTIQKLAERLKSNCMLNLGDYDSNVVVNMFKKLGLEESGIQYCLTNQSKNPQLSNPEYLKAVFVKQKQLPTDYTHPKNRFFAQISTP